MADWETFFAAQVAASATLAGLLFVAVSFNLTKILSNPALPNRALAGFYLLLAVLVISSLMLVPGQPRRFIGAEVLVVAAVLWAVVTRLDVAALRGSPADVRTYFVRHFFLFQAAVLPYLIGAVMILAGAGSGLYWLAAAIIFSLFTAFIEAWVLLVEINR
ncbi:MAG TPA: hypothetical protein VMC05_02240 [Xanthobacteraceae bacterium]|nr:hypothetical protein [Xanthobacteraceae bacterium]